MHEELKVSDSIESRSSGEVSCVLGANLKKVSLKKSRDNLKKLDFKRKS
jgi:hypothetical protein